MMAPAAAADLPQQHVAAVDDGGENDDEKRPWEYSLRKYLLLLATMVATVTYSAGFTPPGGVWQEADEPRHHAGDPILRQTSGDRFWVFFYLNACAFASSLVAIVLILIVSVQHDLKKARQKQAKKNPRLWLLPLRVLRVFMVLDLLTLIGAYTAGIYQERDVPRYSLVLAGLTVVYLGVFHVLPPWKNNKPAAAAEDGAVLPAAAGAEAQAQQMEVDTAPDKKKPPTSDSDKELRKERERPRKVLMLLATFAASVTYLAGLNAPGGFWNSGDHPGEPILMGSPHEMRLKAFVHLNSTAFFFSLFIAVQLLDKNLSLDYKKKELRLYLLFGSIVFALLGLVGAYVAASCRDIDTSIYVTLQGVALPAPACAILLHQLINSRFIPTEVGCMGLWESPDVRKLPVYLLFLLARLLLRSAFVSSASSLISTLQEQSWQHLKQLFSLVVLIFIKMTDTLPPILV